MANTLIQKVIAVSVLVVLVLGAFVPIIADVGVTTETTTETITYATNSLEGYSDAITASSRGNVASITTYRADSDGTENASGDWVYYPIDVLSMLGGKVNAAGTIYANVSNSWVATDLSVQTLPYTAMYTGGTEITFTADPDNAAIADIALTEEGSNVSAVLLPYDVTYYVNTILTYGTNSIHSLVLTDTIGDISQLSTNTYAFTPNAGGDWLHIPSHILRDTTQTYKVLQGSHFYVAHQGGAYYSEYIVGSGYVSMPGLRLDFTQDTSITSATVYDMTATVTDMDMGGIVIEHEVSTTSPVLIQSIHVAGRSDLSTALSYYALTTTGDLYVTGLNEHGQLGLGDRVNRTSWELSRSGVSAVYASQSEWGINTVYVKDAATGQIYGAGGNGVGQITDSNQGSRISTWTLSYSEPTTEVVPSYQATLFIESSGKVALRGMLNTAVNGVTSASNTPTYLYTGGDAVAVSTAHGNTKDTVYILTSNGTLLGAGSNTNGQLGLGDTTDRTTSFETLASGVAKVSSSGQYSGITAAYQTTTGDLYVAGSAFTDTWALHANNVVDFQVAPNDVFYIDTTGTYHSSVNGTTGTVAGSWTALYQDGPRFAVLSGGTSVKYVQIIGSALYPYSQSNVTSVSSVALTIYAKYLVDNSHNLYKLNSGTNEFVQSYEIASTTTIYTNPTETETVSDLRGTMSANTFTADPDGDYLYVPIEDAVDYAYYVSVGSTVYAPNTLGNALAAHTVPDVTGIDPAVTITLTQVAGYNDQIYSVTATTTDTDIVGWAIPYTVTYAGVVDTHYAYNYVGLVGHAFSYASDGSYLKVPYPMTATNGFSYFIDYQGGFYYLDTEGEFVSDTAEGEESIGSATKTLITVGAAENGVCSIELSNGTDGGYMVIPYAYTGGTNEVSSYIITYTPVRGNVSGGSFSAAADGDYIALYSENLENETYYIGTGQAYYVVEGFDTVMETVEAPTGITAVYGAVSFVPTGDNEDVYTVSGSTLSDYGVVVPYTAAYEEVTVVTEVMPMVSIVIVAIIVLILLGVISLIPNFRGGL